MSGSSSSGPSVSCVRGTRGLRCAARSIASGCATSPRRSPRARSRSRRTSWPAASVSLRKHGSLDSATSSGCWPTRPARSWIARVRPRSPGRSTPAHSSRSCGRSSSTRGGPSLVVPEEHGGAGRGLAEVVVVCEQLGRGPIASPLIATTALAALPLLWLGTDAQRRRWLPELARGHPHRHPGAARRRDARRVGRGRRCTPCRRFRARRSSCRGRRRPTLMVVATADGAARRRARAARRCSAAAHDSLGGDPLATVVFDARGLRATRAPRGRERRRSSGPSTMRQSRSSPYTVGVAERALELSVQHAHDRHQFGRPIGSFQAVAHRCADMRADIDACRYLAHQAAWALDRGNPADVAVASAKAYGNDAMRRVFRHAHQVHGAIGFSTEHDLHLFTRRAKAFELTLRQWCSSPRAARVRDGPEATRMTPQPETFARALTTWAADQPDKTAVVDDARRLTYAELDALVDAVAAGLQRSGIGPGDVVSSQLDQLGSTRWCCASLPPASARCTIPSSRSTATARSASSGTRPRARCSSSIADDDALDVQSGQRPRPPPRSTSTRRASCCTRRDRRRTRRVSCTRTGRCSPSARRKRRYHGMTDDEVFVMPSPVAHVSGLLYGVLLPDLARRDERAHARSGIQDASSSWSSPRAGPSAAARRRSSRASSTTPISTATTSRRCGCSRAAAPTSRPTSSAARSRGSVCASGRGYGSTEFPSITSSAGPGEPEDKRAETDGRPIGANRGAHPSTARSRLSGPELFLGYRIRRSTVTPSPTTAGSAPATSACSMTEGYLTVTGRLKDIVIRSGEKLSAREVEDLLHEHPQVRAVGGRRSPRRAHRRARVRVRRAPRRGASPDARRARRVPPRPRCSRVGSSPSSSSWSASLPMTASGKVKKHELRARVTAAHLALRSEGATIGCRHRRLLARARPGRRSALDPPEPSGRAQRHRRRDARRAHGRPCRRRRRRRGSRRRDHRAGPGLLHRGRPHAHLAIPRSPRARPRAHWTTAGPSSRGSGCSRRSGSWRRPSSAR